MVKIVESDYQYAVIAKFDIMMQLDVLSDAEYEDCFIIDENGDEDLDNLKVDAQWKLHRMPKLQSKYDRGSDDASIIFFIEWRLN